MLLRPTHLVRHEDEFRTRIQEWELLTLKTALAERRELSRKLARFGNSNAYDYNAVEVNVLVDAINSKEAA